MIYRRTRFAVGAWVVLVIAVALGFLRLEQLGKQNRARIHDIQQSRLESCQATYNSFHIIFDPFFPPKGHRTAKQQTNLKKFDAIIAKKIRECRGQVTPPKVNP